MESLLGLIFFLLYWAVFVYSIVLHEMAHGWVALRLGDPTAMQQGRLSLNPLRHIEPIQSIVMPLVFFVSVGIPFGGARPVPVNPYMFRNLRRGILLDSAAGPATNLLLAAFFALGLTLSRLDSGLLPTEIGALSLTGRFFGACMMLNVFLAAFNLLPIPPLDGSKVLSTLLPGRMGEGLDRMQSLGLWPIMIVVIANSAVHGMLLGPPLRFIASLVLRLLGVARSAGEYNELLGLFNPMKLLGGG